MDQKDPINIINVIVNINFITKNIIITKETHPKFKINIILLDNVIFHSFQHVIMVKQF